MDVTADEIAAMYLYADDYALRGWSAREFYRQLPEAKRQLAQELVDKITAAIRAGRLGR